MDFLGMLNLNYRILVVEDNIADARLIEEYLSEFMIINEYFTYDLTHVQTLKDAIAISRKQKFDIVLLDLSLPDSLCLETFQLFHEANPELPVIILSGYDRAEMEIRAVQEGAQDYLVKGSLNGNLLFRSMQYAIERQRLLQELHALSLRDELTGLYNRRGFMTLAEQQMKNARRNGEYLVLLFLDLDNMKTINDQLGHTFGDIALTETAGLLQGTFRDSDICARMGGDEFAALAITRNEHATVMKSRLLDNLADLNKNPGRQFELLFSIGTAESTPANSSNLQQLIDIADAAMYREKKLHKGENSRQSFRRAA